MKLLEMKPSHVRPPVYYCPDPDCRNEGRQAIPVPWQREWDGWQLWCANCQKLCTVQMAEQSRIEVRHV